MKRFVRATTSFTLTVLMSVPSTVLAARKDKNKEKEEEEAPASESARQEYSDKDKKTMAEIAQRPEVQKEIEAAWQAQRRQDVVEAFNVNTGRTPGYNMYPNPIVNDYVNTLGQRLVPKDSPNLYAFRLLLDPMPRAESLSTGTIYVSTGLVSMLDNEAQLAYILAHEVAHVERGHMYQRIRNPIIEERLAFEKQKQAAKKKAIFGALGAVAGAAVGAAAGGNRSQNALIGAEIGLLGGIVTGSIVTRGKFQPTEWDTLQEDEADETGLGLILDQKFDPREVPKTYARLDTLVTRDSRVGLGFMGSKQRVKERTANIERLLAGALKVKVDAQMQAGGLVGGSPEFALLMSALKRDNGVEALDYDLFAMAKENLQDAANLRSNDSRVHYYLGKVTSLTARTDEDRQAAASEFLTAIRYDAKRGSYPEPHLQRALHLIKQNNSSNQGEIQDELKAYVTLYQRQHAGNLPSNMHIIYDYFLLAGDTAWYVPPFSVVQTKYVDWPLAVVPAASRKTLAIQK